MVKSIKFKPTLPIEPTATPNGSHVGTVALAIVKMAQLSLLSPAAVVSALRAAMDLYTINLEAKGFDVTVIAQAEDIGTKMAQTLLEVGEEEEDLTSSLVTPSGRLVSPNGEPIV